MVQTKTVTCTRLLCAPLIKREIQDQQQRRLGLTDSALFRIDHLGGEQPVLERRSVGSALIRVRINLSQAKITSDVEATAFQC